MASYFAAAFRRTPPSSTDLAPVFDPFPGRWVGGAALVLGPLLLLAGMLLRFPIPFFFPDQLAAAARDPGRMQLAYGFVAAGTLALWPAILLLVQCIAPSHPALARWAGVFVISGLIARTFHAGADHLAMQAAASHPEGPRAAATTELVAETYGAFHAFKLVSPMILSGWVLLALGAFRARALGAAQSGALALMAGVPLGVLKGTSLFSLLGVGGLCLALLPLGARTLLRAPRPAPRTAAGWLAAMVALGIAFVLLGQAG